MVLPSGNYISLFAGCGGFDLGLRIACPETRCVGYVEISAETACVLASRIEDGSIDAAPIWSDVRTFDGGRRSGQVDGIIGGFPCQDVSVAGKRAGLSGKRSGLWGEFERLIEEIQPSWVCIENVGGLLSSLTLLHRPEILGHFDAVLDTAKSPKERYYAKCHIDRLQRRILPIYGISALHYVQACLGRLGYESEAGLFTAAEVGAAHDRLRVFILAYRKGGGLRELRQPSRSNGLADGSDETMGHTEGDNKRGAPGAGVYREWLPAGGSGGSVANAARDERNRPHGQAGPGRGIREAGEELADSEVRGREGSGLHISEGDRPQRGVPILSGAVAAMADTGDGLLPEPGRRSEERDGAGPADTLLANAEYGGAQREHEPGGAGRGRTESPRSLAVMAGTDALAAGGESGLIRSETATGEGEGTQRERDGRTAGYGSVDLGDTDLAGLEGRDERERRLSDERIIGEAGDPLRRELPLFAPGPSDIRWPAILTDHPWLAPAISEEEAESILRRIFNGSTDEFDIEDRTDRLRAIGNMVCPLQSAFAITVLAQRPERCRIIPPPAPAAIHECRMATAASP